MDLHYYNWMISISNESIFIQETIETNETTVCLQTNSNSGDSSDRRHRSSDYWELVSTQIAVDWLPLTPTESDWLLLSPIQPNCCKLLFSESFNSYLNSNSYFILLFVFSILSYHQLFDTKSLNLPTVRSMNRSVKSVFGIWFDRIDRFNDRTTAKPLIAWIPHSFIHLL